MINKNIFLVFIFFLLTSCVHNTKSNRLLTYTVTNKSTILNTSEFTTPTKQIIAPTINKYPSKTPDPNYPIYLEYEITPGDGGMSGDELFFLPKYTIYKSKQLIFVQWNNHEAEVRKKTLSENDISELFNKIAKTGIYEVDLSRSGFVLPYEDPIYQGVKNKDFCMGCQIDKITIDGEAFGNPYMQLFINPSLYEYLIPQVHQTFEIIKNYYPEYTKLYKPEGILLWIDIENRNMEGEKIYSWNKELPLLSKLLDGHIGVEILMGMNYVPMVMQMYDSKITYHFYLEGQIYYYVAARPILPIDKIYNNNCNSPITKDLLYLCYFNDPTK